MKNVKKWIVERNIFLNDKNINPRTLFKSTNKKFKFKKY